jgi:hypothetical protein
METAEKAGKQFMMAEAVREEKQNIPVVADKERKEHDMRAGDKDSRGEKEEKEKERKNIEETGGGKKKIEVKIKGAGAGGLSKAKETAEKASVKAPIKEERKQSFFNITGGISERFFQYTGLSGGGSSQSMEVGVEVEEAEEVVEAGEGDGAEDTARYVKVLEKGDKQQQGVVKTGGILVHRNINITINTEDDRNTGTGTTAPATVNATATSASTAASDFRENVAITKQPASTFITMPSKEIFDRGFRQFLVLQTGPNSSGNDCLFIGGLELYGTLLIADEDKQQQTQKVASSTGNDEVVVEVEGNEKGNEGGEAGRVKGGVGTRGEGEGEGKGGKKVSPDPIPTHSPERRIRKTAGGGGDIVQVISGKRSPE